MEVIKAQGGERTQKNHKLNNMKGKNSTTNQFYYPLSCVVLQKNQYGNLEVFLGKKGVQARTSSFQTRFSSRDHLETIYNTSAMIKIPNNFLF